MRHAVLDAVARKRGAQQVVEIVLRHDPFIGARRADHEDELAAGFQLIGGLRQLRDRRTRDVLVQFGEFAADRSVAPAHDVSKIGECVLHPVAGFEHHERSVDPGELREPRSPRDFLGGQKSLEEEPVGGECGDRKRRQHRGRARHGDHGMAGGTDLAHQLEAGVRYQGRAGIRHQRDRGAVRQLFQNFRPRHRRVVLVIRLELCRDRIAFGQAAGDAGVLAGDDVDAGQCLQRAQGNVAEIADRRCHQIEAGNRLRGIQDVAADRKCSVGRTRFGVGAVVGTGFCAHNANLKGSWCQRHIRRQGGKAEVPRGLRCPAGP